MVIQNRPSIEEERQRREDTLEDTLQQWRSHSDPRGLNRKAHRPAFLMMADGSIPNYLIQKFCASFFLYFVI